jgi:predicted GIY-YIG superfamily endonuclease
MPDYSKSKIYKLQCEDGHFYIGSTASELRFRLQNHKGISKRNTEQRVYKHIGTDWNKVKIVLIEELRCENKQQLNRREDEFIQQHRENPMCLNSIRAFRTNEERLEAQRIYEREHFEERQPYMREWRDANREYINERQRQYNANKKMTRTIENGGDIQT